MKQFVVYTVQTGGYDMVQQPLVVDDRFDYILFTDIIESQKDGVWELREIPFKDSNLSRMSRYPKMHCSELLPDYKASLYIDANIQITGHRIYDRCIEMYNQGVEWAGIFHPERDCIYDEACEVVKRGLEEEKVVFTWCHQLREENYPRHNGLLENNTIFRIHNQNIESVNKLWWNTYLKYSRRDQLTLCYVLWKYPIHTDYLLPFGEHYKKSTTISCYGHNAAKTPPPLKQSYLEHARQRYASVIKEKETSIRDVYYFLFGLNPSLARILLRFWGVYIVFVYGLIIKYRVYIKNNVKSKNMA